MKYTKRKSEFMKIKRTIKYFLTIIIIFGILINLGVFKVRSQENYSSETKAFETDEYICDLYIEYDNHVVTNITLIDCIKKVN